MSILDAPQCSRLRAAKWEEDFNERFAANRRDDGSVVTRVGRCVPCAGGGIQVVSVARAAMKRRLVRRSLYSRRLSPTRREGVLVTGSVGPFVVVSRFSLLCFVFPAGASLSLLKSS